MVFHLRYTLFIYCFLWLLTTAQAQMCNGSLGDPVVNITFGTGTNTTQLQTIAPGASTDYIYVTHNCPNDGYYTISNTIVATAGYTCFGDDWYHPTEDHTPNDVNGNFAVYNTRNLTTGTMYVQTIGGLCASTTYEFASWVANLVKIGVCGAGAVHPNLTFQIEDLSGNVLGTYTTGTIQPTPTFTWKQYGLVFKTPANVNQVVLKIISMTPGGCGNDLVLDDITFRPCGPTVAVASSVPVIYAGESATLTATVSAGYDNPVYQWQQSNDGGLTWTDIFGENSLTYNIINAVAGTTYRLLVAEKNNITIPTGRTASNPAPLTINPVLELTTPPTFSEVYVGTLIDLVDFTSNPTAIYNWQIDNTSLGLSQTSGVGQVPIFIATGVGTITFTVTATLNGYTSKPQTFVLKISPALTVSLTSDQSVISKGNKAILTASAAGGTPNYTFSWSNNLVGGSVQTVSPDTSTIYTVTVTDSKGYAVTNSIKILVNAPPIILKCTKIDVKCNGQANGSLTITATGAGTLQYSLDGVIFQNSSIFNGLSAGNYTVTVKDGNGSISQKSIDINQPSAIQLEVVAKNATCFQSADGAITVSVNGDAAPYSYQWSDGINTSANIIGRSAGTYSVVVTDANGCAQTISATISQPVQISLTTVVSDIACNGGKTGKIDLAINSVAAIKSILWSNGAITEDLSNLAAGTYSVTVTDNGGCSVSNSVTIKETTKITLSTAVVAATCNGGKDGKITASATGGSGGFLYALCSGSNCVNFGANQANGIFSGLSQGVYRVQVTDTHGCKAVSNDITITQPIQVIASASSNSPICSGAALNLTAVNAGTNATYSWIGPNGFGSTEQYPIRTNTTTDMGGTYTLVVKDANGCINSAQLNIVINDRPKVAAGADQTICLGSLAMLKSTASSGQGPYVFSWNNNLSNSTVQTVSPSITTDYVVLVSDKNGCKNTDTIRVNIKPLPQIFNLVQPTKNVYCAGEAGLPISLSGSENGVLYELIKNNISTGQMRMGTGSAISFGPQLAGNFKVMATTNSNPVCIVEMNGVVSFKELPSIFAAFSYPLDVVCYGSSAAVEVVVSGGSGMGYSYLWQDGSTKNPAQFRPTTPYTNVIVKVTDSEGCQTQAQADLNRADSLKLDLSASQSVICAGESVALIASALGSSGLFKYKWEDGSSSANRNINPNTTGTYIIKVTDVKLGCTAKKSIEIKVNQSPKIFTVSSGSSGCPATGEVQISLSGSEIGVNYQLKIEGNTLGSTAGTGSALDFGKQTTPGTYTIAATSITNPFCTETMTGSVQITANQAPQITTNAQPSMVCEGQPINLSTTPIITGTYVWTGPNGFTSNNPTPTIPNTTIANGGIYNVTVIDENGCKQTGSITAIVTAKFTAKVIANGPICENQTLRLSADDFGRGAIYDWTGPNGFTVKNQQNIVIDNVTLLQSGTYELTVSKGGCMSTVQYKVIVNQNPVAKATTNSPICEGEKINLLAQNSGTGAVYQWNGPIGFVSNNQNSIVESSLASAGKYVLVVSQNGCTKTDSVRVIVRPRPQITTPTVAPICEGQFLTINTSTDPNATSYSWTGPNGFVSPEQNAKIEKTTLGAAGIYQLTASLDGCSAKASTAVTINAKPMAIASTSAPICEDNTVFVNATNAGLSAKYSWTGPNGFNSITPNNTFNNVTTNIAGVYKLTVTLGQCINSDTALVVVYPKPTLKIASTSCSSNFKTYAILLTATGGKVTTSAGSISNSSNGGNSFTVSNIASSISKVLVTVTTPEGCTITEAVTAPSCSCPTVAEPVNGGDKNSCEGQAIPVLSVTTTTDETVDWYDSASGGNVLAQNIYSYTPALAGTYYAQARNQTTDCISSNRTAIKLIVNPLPTFKIDSIRCNPTLKTYNVFGSSNGSVSAAQGTVSQVGNLFSVKNITVGQKAILTFRANTCDTTYSVDSPTCICPLTAPSVVPTSQNICLGDTFMTLKANVGGPDITADWYDAPTGGNIVSAGSLSYKPTAAGKFYVQARIAISGCFNNIRAVSVAAIAPLPIFKATVSPNTCQIDIANSDAKITVSQVQNGQKYDVSLGKKYVGNKTLATAAAIPTDGVILNNLPNPDSVVYYTIRVFGQSGCSKDSTVKLSRQNCQCLGISPIVIPESQNVCFGDTFRTLTGNVAAGMTVNWYDQNNNLLKANSLTFKPTNVGTFYAQAVVLATGCKSNVKVPSTTAVSALPIFKATVSPNTCQIDIANSDAKITVSQVQNGQKYDVSLGKKYVGNKTLATAAAIPTDGVILNNLPNPDSVVYYTIRVFGQTGCTKDSTVKLSRQNCQCLGISPIVIPESQNVCFGDTFRTLTGHVAAGMTVNWYDQNNNLLKANSLTFKPTNVGTFYAQAVVLATSCKSNVKVPSTTAVSALPIFKATVSPNTCQIDIANSDAKITVSQVQNGQKYDVSLGKKYVGNKTLSTASAIPTDGIILNNLPNPDSVVYYTIRVFGQTGCSKDSTVKLSRQNCQCLGISPIVIPESQNVCFGDTFRTLTGHVAAGMTVNWYDQNNNLLKANSLTFKPTNVGTFYAQAVVLATGCKSNVKVPSTTAVSALPIFKAIVSPNTCQIDIANSDAKITVSQVQNGQKYDVSLGKKYVGNKTLATAAAIPTDGVILNNLPNPDSVVYYTIRVFGQTGCSKDSTVKLSRQNCVNCKFEPFELRATTSSCNGVQAKNDAVISISKLSSGKRYDYSLTDVYTGSADYSTAKVIPSDSILAKNLANPDKFQTYTVRIFEASGCFTDKNIVLLAAQCSCSPIPIEIIPASFSICKNEKIPTFHAYPADTTVKISWYDSPSGGTPLSVNSATYTPTRFGVFYVQGRIEKTGCVSTVKTPATLLEIGNPTFTVAAKPTTCFGDSARKDGQLIIANGVDIGSFDFSLGNTYTGNTSYNELNLIPADGIIIKNLPNQNQNYTVRIFNKCGLHSDYTIKFAKTTCICSPPQCFQVQMQRKVKK